MGDGLADLSELEDYGNMEDGDERLAGLDGLRELYGDKAEIP